MTTLSSKTAGRTESSELPGPGVSGAEEQKMIGGATLRPRRPIVSRVSRPLLRTSGASAVEVEQVEERNPPCSSEEIQQRTLRNTCRFVGRSC